MTAKHFLKAGICVQRDMQRSLCNPGFSPSRAAGVLLIALLLLLFSVQGSHAQSAILPTCYRSGTELWCVNPAIPRYNQNNPSLNRKWFPTGQSNSMLCVPATGAMALSGALRMRGNATYKDPFVNSFLPLWRDKTTQGEASQIELIAKIMNTHPVRGTLNEFDFGFSQRDFTKFFKDVASNFKAPGGAVNFYSSLEDRSAILGAKVGTPLKATTVANLFRKGYILSLGVGYYIDTYSDDSARYLVRAGGHQVLLAGVIYPQTGPIRFLVADPLRPESMRQLTIGALPGRTINGFDYWRVEDATGNMGLSDTVYSNFDFLNYVDSYSIDLQDAAGAPEAHQVYEVLDHAVGFSVQLYNATPTPGAARF
jgi:hypothetical protein